MEQINGIFGMASNITPVNIKQWKTLGYKGVKWAMKWYKMQPTENDFSFVEAYNGIKLLVEAGLYINIQTWTGNNAPLGGMDGSIQRPDWLKKKGVNTFYTTGHELNGPWPNYYDDAYTEAFNNWHTGFANFLSGLPLEWKMYIKSVFVSNGATGDGQPYKGTAPFGWEHIQDDEQWNNFCKMEWEFCKTQYDKNDFMVMALNPNNNGEMVSYCVEKFPNAYLKHGDASHEVPVEGADFSREWPKTQWFGEIDDMILRPKWPEHAACVQFQCVRSALDINTQRLDFMQEWISNRYVPVFVEFFHKHVGSIYNDNPSVGFCALAEIADFLNTTDYPFPLDLNGEVILWDDKKLYDNSIKNVDTNYPDRWVNEQRKVQVAIGRSNSIRIQKFREKGYPRGLTGNSDYGSADYYNNDMSYYVRSNYQQNITQIFPFQTSKGIYRVDDGSCYGRNAKAFKLYNGKYAMYFQLNQSLKQTIASDRVRITVTYKDTNDAIWDIRCAFNQRCRITNTSTNEWKKVFFDIEDFKFGGRMENGADIIITLIKGDVELTYFEMIEFENLDKIGYTPRDFDIFQEAGVVLGQIELDPPDMQDSEEIIGAEKIKS